MNIVDYLNEKIGDEIRKFGYVNVLITGRTGVGKSTLINAVFEGNLAETGSGRPVTAGTTRYGKPGIPAFLYDTRGLEMQDFPSIITGLETFISQERAKPQSIDHIHVAWICIDEGLRRVEEGDQALAAMLERHSIPSLAVITKAQADADGEFREQVRKLLPATRNRIRVMAKAQTLDDGHIIKARGLETLIDATVNLLPEGLHNAFVAAQRVDIGQKKNAAHKVVAVAAAAAGSAAAINPIPAADAAILPTMVVTMLTRISLTFGLPVDRVVLVSSISAILTGALGWAGAQQTLGNLLKFVPGLGTLPGAAMAASGAITLVTTIGEAYIVALAKLIEKHGRDNIAPADLAREFKAAIKGNS